MTKLNSKFIGSLLFGDVFRSRTYSGGRKLIFVEEEDQFVGRSVISVPSTQDVNSTYMAIISRKYGCDLGKWPASGIE